MDNYSGLESNDVSRIIDFDDTNLVMRKNNYAHNFRYL